MQDDDTDLDIDQGPREPPGSALARVRAMSLALNAAARRTRLSSRRARQLTSGGFQGRRDARAARYLVWASFGLVFAAPTLAAIVYFGFIASDLFVSHAEFTVSAGESPLRDGVSSFSGVPGMLIVQDTQIVTNFIQSREMIDKLESKVGLRAVFSRASADGLSRFNPARPVERLMKYWKKMANASIRMPGGIVRLDVSAFTPDDAKRVADATLGLCEELISDLNARINRDALSLAQAGFERAGERLSRTLAAQEVARNESGMLETRISGEAISTLIKQLRGALIEQTGSYEAELKSMHAEAPQMRERKIRIDVMARQLAELEGELTSAPDGANLKVGQNLNPGVEPGGRTVSAAMVKFDTLESQKKVDLQIYENAAEALEHARVAAEFKIVYFKVFVRPSLPEEPEYPHRRTDMALVAVSSLAAWGVLIAVASAVRNNMA
jgi:capsular polysaccharide transport system permease protein